MSDSNEIAKILQAEVDRQATIDTVPGMADLASAVLNSRWGKAVRKREVERRELRKAVEGLLDLVKGWQDGIFACQGTQWDVQPPAVTLGYTSLGLEAT